MLEMVEDETGDANEEKGRTLFFNFKGRRTAPPMNNLTTENSDFTQTELCAPAISVFF